ncbi:uncharacterized protein [Epargyreus clarus]|uniref:uncharacterized protein n=1 Tax=Epargyreus clarus TaxID=520877 RepID=UPI003C2B45E8
MSKKSSLEAVTVNKKPDATETTPLVPKSELEGGEGGNKNESSGLSMKQAAFLIAGEMAGAGVLALPRALVKTGWVGVPLIILTCLMAAFSGKRLGDCWTMIEARQPDLRTVKRNPYAIIAENALGKTWSAVVSMALVVTQFGIAVVYLLLAAQIVEQLFSTLVPTFTICIWTLIVAGAMTPLLLFGTPKDFSYLGIIAFFSAVVACVMYFIEMMSEIRPFVFRWGIHGFADFFLAVGIIMFAFGGAASFPTIQNDMADRTQFTNSLQYSFLATLAMYLPIAIGGYAVYGESVGSNVALSLSATPLTLVGNIFMAAHLVAAFIITVNPVCQEVEEMYNTPRESLGHRTLVRLSIMLAILFIGESIPRFYTILSLVGGSTIALLTFVLPSYCYLSLVNSASTEGQAPIASPPGWMRMVCWEVIAVGAVGGALAAACALSAIFSTAQVLPCYLR